MVIQMIKLKARIGLSIFLYRLILIIVYPLIYIYLLIRKFKGKEDKKRFPERFGKTKIVKPEGKLIWFNAVSLGEINSAWSIIKKLNDEGNYNILITTTTLTSAENVAERIKKLEIKNNKLVIHQFVPIDFQFCIARFLKHWRPDILVNVESEFWPNLFTMTKKMCPIIVLNGKMSKKSFKFWYVNKKLKESIFDSIDICLAQSKSDYKRFIMLGVQNVQFLVNTKFFADRSNVDEKLYKYLKEKTKDKKIWLVNCSHKGEEEIIVETHNMLKKVYNNIMTILIIRHPNRIKEVEKILENNNINYIITTSDKDIDENTEFYIYDKIGNLGTFFDLSSIVFMGGSLQKGIGGHTPAEAIRHNCCTVTGPYIENNYMLFKELSNIDGCIILKDNKSKTLFEKVDFLFQNPFEVKKIVDNSYRKSIQNLSIFNEIVDIIKNKIN